VKVPGPVLQCNIEDVHRARVDVDARVHVMDEKDSGHQKWTSTPRVRGQKFSEWQTRHATAYRSSCTTTPWPRSRRDSGSRPRSHGGSLPEWESTRGAEIDAWGTDAL